MLKIRNLNIQYADRTVVRDFQADIESGEIVSIVGESGSGKTTVIRSILGLLPADGKIESGEIDFQGRDLTGLTPEEYLKLRGKDITMIFQDSGAMMNPTRRIGGQFTEYLLEHSDMTKEEAHACALELLASVHLPSPEAIMRRYPFQLSGGQRQRVGIAMAIAFSPKILLADEPTSALDVTTQAQVVRLMMELREKYGTTIVMVTHNLGVASFISDQIIVMKDGEIVEAGPAREFIREPKTAYTRKLLDAVPVLREERDAIETILRKE